MCTVYSKQLVLKMIFYKKNHLNYFPDNSNNIPIPTEFFMAMLVCAIHSTLATEQMVYNESTMIITTVKPSS